MVEPIIRAFKEFFILFNKNIEEPMVTNCSIISLVTPTTVFRIAIKYPLRQEETAMNISDGERSLRGTAADGLPIKLTATKSDEKKSNDAAARLKHAANSAHRLIVSLVARFSETRRVTVRLIPEQQRVIPRINTDSIS